MKFIQRNDFPTPVQADMELMDLHLGCVMHVDDPDKRLVAIILQPADALVTERKVGHLLNNWHEVADVIQGLVAQATMAWGEPDWKK